MQILAMDHVFDSLEFVCCLHDVLLFHSNKRGKSFCEVMKFVQPASAHTP